MSNNYCNFLHLPNLPDYIIDDSLNAEYQYNNSPNVIRADAHKFTQTNFYKKLQETFGECKAHYIKNPPYMLYDWHTDTKRYCGINWVIKTNENANTFFRELYEDDTYGREVIAKCYNPLIWKLEKVNYILQKPTLFRTTEPHCVVNNSDKERIILTVAATEPTYEEMLRYLACEIIESY